MKRTLVLLSVVLAFLVSAMCRAHPARAETISCNPVTQYTDGQFLAFGESIGYTFYIGTFPGNYTEEVWAGWDITNALLPPLVAGTTYYISAKALSGLFLTESEFAQEISYFYPGVAQRVPVYRFRNKANWTYLYTINEMVRDFYLGETETWAYEGISFWVFAIQQAGTVPVHEFMNKTNWTFLYTADEAEKNYFIGQNEWKYNGVQFYVFATPQTGTIPAYRFRNKKVWSYLFVTNEAEKNFYLGKKSDWKYEGEKFQVFENQY